MQAIWIKGKLDFLGPNLGRTIVLNSLGPKEPK